MKTAIDARPVDPCVKPRPCVEQPRPEDWSVALLNIVRLKALRCRSAARTDLFRACAVLSLCKETAWDAYAEALVRCLAEATGKRLILHRPGAQEHSFDEAWLLRLIMCAREGDEDSFGFLVRSRVRASAQRNFSFLIRALVARADTV